MRDPIRRAEQLFADQEAVVCGDTRRSFGELATRIRKVAGLCESISEPGDRIALWSANGT